MLARTLAAVLVLGLLAGCGGDGGGENGMPRDEDPGEARSAQQQNAYDAARTNCADFGVRETARQLGVDVSSPEEVAQAYAEEVSTPDFQDASRDGCLAGLEE